MTAHSIRPMYFGWPLAEYQRVAWFLFECFERERRLNIEALSTSPPFSALTLTSPIQPLLFFFPASMWVVSPAKK